MSTATVKYIANGYTVQSFGTATIPESVYAGSIPEVVYWIGRLFEPLAAVEAPPPAARNLAPRSIVDDDPLMNQTAQVETIGSGGYLVRQNAGMNGVQQIDTYCVSMDAVSDALTQIFTPPPPAVLAQRRAGGLPPPSPGPLPPIESTPSTEGDAQP